MTEVTRILNQIEQGDPSAADKLLPLVYQELRNLARHRLADEKPGQSLQATALVHEAYLRLVGDDVQWNSRGHFFAAAGEAMRRILINRARDRARLKRGGERRRIDLSKIILAINTADESLIELDEALEKLSKRDALSANLVKLRFFAGLSHQDACKSLGIPRGQGDRLWAYARAWLYDRLQRD